MKIKIIIITSLFLISVFCSCKNSKSKIEENEISFESNFDSTSINLLTDINPNYKNGMVNAIVEIPSGTLEKWELNKTTGQIEWEKVNDIPRIINYLGYPGNYGFIPQTLLSKEKGGDGDPLDIIILGPPSKRGSVIRSKIIGVLKLLDNGEQDDKLLAVSNESPLHHINSIEELQEKYSGITEIIKLWFSNYKGSGQMKTNGFGDKNKAIEILNTAMQAYK
jgi:inorganic pyrophosphatase